MRRRRRIIGKIMPNAFGIIDKKENIKYNKNRRK
jgi:hypothetical protein